MAGYSTRTLVEKLGIQSGWRIALINAPLYYRQTLGPLPVDITVMTQPDGPCELLQLFVVSRQALARQFPAVKQAMAPEGMVWISWPKGSSKKVTDLNEDRVREIGLGLGLVDVKVCAVDDTWSGLKFVIRVRDRAVAKSRPRSRKPVAR